jgi:hypothetical protein
MRSASGVSLNTEHVTHRVACPAGELGYNPAALWVPIGNPKARTHEINP